MANVVIMETIRGGRDPDEYYHVLTKELADSLDTLDPWKDLDDNDPGVLQSFLDSEETARQWCLDNGHLAEESMLEAVGY